MAGIKNINVISGTGNPVQMQDLQNLWSAINSLLRSTKTPISIVAGFATANNDTGTNIGEGIICYQGQAYYLAADVAKIGQYLYANTIQDEQRVYEDGTTRYTYQDYVVNAAANASASGIGTLIGQATAANLAAWKVGVLSDGSVTAAMLADGAVTTAKIANGAVGGLQIADKAITAEKIADATITATQIASEAITNEEILNYTINAAYKMVPSSVEESCIATAAVGSRQLQVAAVNTPAIMNKAITFEKLADKISVLLPNTVTSIPYNNITPPIDFPEGTIGILNIPRTNPSSQAITIHLVKSPSGLLVHHWTMLVFKTSGSSFQITFSGESIDTTPFGLPPYATKCILDIYYYRPYGLIVGEVSQLIE